MPKKKKNTHGGKRAGAGTPMPVDGIRKPYAIRLNDKEKKYLIDKCDSVLKAVRTLLKEPGTYD